MKVAFFASDAIAIGAMEFLKSRGVLSCLVSNPDRPKGRGNRVSPNAAASWAIENGVELLRPEKSPDSETLARLEELGADCFVVMAYGKFLKDAVINFPKKGCLNLHASILPKYRGASPVETAIALGESETGVSLMRITHEMDAGPVADILKIEISSSDTSHTLREKLCALAAEVLKKNFDAIDNGNLNFTEQDFSRATYCRKLSKSDAALDFSLSAGELCARIRAFNFGTFEVGETALKTDCASAEEFFVSEFQSFTSAKIGTVLCADLKRGLKILCGKNSALNIITLQKPCAKMMPATETLKSFQIEVGKILETKKCESLLR